MKNLQITINDIPDNINITGLNACIYNYLSLFQSNGVYKLGVASNGYNGFHSLDIECLYDELDYILWQLKHIVNEYEHKMICNLCDKVLSNHNKYIEKLDNAIQSFKAMEEKYKWLL